MTTPCSYLFPEMAKIDINIQNVDHTDSTIQSFLKDKVTEP